MNDPSLLSKTVMKGTHHRAQHGVAQGQPAVCTRRLFIITQGESGAQGGAVLFCFGFFLEQWGQNCKGQERTLKTHFMGLSQMTLKWSVQTSRQCFLVTEEEAGAVSYYRPGPFLSFPAAHFPVILSCDSPQGTFLVCPKETLRKYREIVMYVRPGLEVLV